MPAINVTRSYERSETTYTFGQQNGQPYSNSTTSSGYVASESRIRTTTGTPNYKKVRDSPGLLPNNNFSFTSERKAGGVHQGSRVVRNLTDDKNRLTSITTGAAISVAGPDMSYFDVSPSEQLSIQNQVANKVLLKIKSQKVNMAQAWAERKQTADLVLSSCQRMIAFYRGLRKGDIRKAGEALGVTVSRRQAARGHRNYRDLNLDDFMSKSVLEFQYGWRPLMGDVFGAIEQMAQNASVRPEINRVVATERVSGSDQRVSKPSSITTDTLTRTCERTVKFTLWFRVDGSYSRAAAQIGLTNPALVAWELVPWSFVFDWFLPVGDWISTWDATVGCTFVGGCRTDCVKQNTTGMRVTKYETWNESTFRSILDNWEKVTISRTPLTGFPGSRPPSFENPFSVQRMVNSMALLRQLTLRK